MMCYLISEFICFEVKNTTRFSLYMIVKKHYVFRSNTFTMCFNLKQSYMLTLVAINIVNNDTLLNKGGIPVVLYTTDIEQTMIDIRDVNTEVGQSMRTFIVNNIIRKTYNKELDDNSVDDFTGSVAKYIYYNPDNKQSRLGLFNLQDLFRLDILSVDADVFYMSLYYIKKALNNVIRERKLRQMQVRKYDIATINTLPALNKYYNGIIEKYNKDILCDVKKSMCDKLKEYGISEDNIKRLVYVDTEI